MRTLLAIVWIAGAVGAEGMIEGRGDALAEITEVRALIRWDGGVERRVIEATFRGSGTGFAWIAPVPAEPRVGASTAGIFTTLSVLVQPDLVGPGMPFWGIGIVFVLLLLAVARRRSVRARWRVAWLFVATLLGVLAWGLLGVLPPRSHSPVERLPIHIADDPRAAVVETAANAGGELAAWLAARGFTAREAPPRAAVSLLARERAEGESRTGLPLIVEFASERPILPAWRLPEGCRIEVYLRGESRAEAPGLESVWCGPIHDRLLRFPEVRRFAERAKVLTKLEGSIPPGATAGDIVCSWVPFLPLRPALHTLGAARTRAANVGVGLALALWTAWALRDRGGGPRVPVAVGLCGLLAAGNVYAAPSEAETVTVRTHAYNFNHREAAREIRAKAAGDLVAARAVLAAWPWRRNPFTDRPVREEDSPGNHILELEGGIVAYRYVDAWGGPGEPPDW